MMDSVRNMLSYSTASSAYDSVYPSNETEVFRNRVADCLIGKKILISGATGFLGKVLLEQILRLCPNVGTIYILARSKKGKSVSERMRVIFQDPLFDKLKKMHGDILNEKVVVMNGEVAAPDLGISEADRRVIIENVNIVYHCAATVRFEEALKNAILINVRGTKLMLELASEIKNLELYVQVSTAYCHLQEDVLEEKVYPICEDPYQLIKIAELLEVNHMEAISEQLRNGCPNSYSFTKALGEKLVAEYMPKIPAIILRPSILTGILDDPLPGWSDNIYGPFASSVAIGKGVLRSLNLDPNIFSDFMPIDKGASIVLLFTYHCIVNNCTHLQVFNVCSSAQSQYTWGLVANRDLKIVREKYPYEYTMWYPTLTFNPNIFLHFIYVFFLQLMPAVIGDIFLFVFGYDPILIRVQKKIFRGSKGYECYTSKQITMRNEKFVEFRNNLNPLEAEVFKLEASKVSKAKYEQYLEDMVLYRRLHVLKESKESLPGARRHLARLYYLHQFAKFLFYGYLVWILYSNIHVLTSVITFIGDLFIGSSTTSIGVESVDTIPNIK